jgi:hypothetical protein
MTTKAPIKPAPNKAIKASVEQDGSAKLLRFFAVFAIACGVFGMTVDCYLPHLHWLSPAATSVLKAYLSFQCLVTVVTLVTVAMKRPKLAIILFVTSTLMSIWFFSHTHLTSGQKLSGRGSPALPA